MLMECKVENFQMSPSFATSTVPHNGTQEGMYKCNKPTIELTKRTGQLTEASTQQLNKNNCSNKTDNANVALNLCPDGSEIDISINGTTLKANKSSIHITIGNFTININSLGGPCDFPLPNIVPVISVSKGAPLHIVLGDSPDVRATLALSEVINDTGIHLVNLASNGQGEHYLSASNNSHYVAIDSSNSIQALSECEIANTNMYVFKQEAVVGAVAQVRYYLEKDEDKYYLMVTSEGDVTTLHADNLEIGSLNDLQCRFRY